MRSGRNLNDAERLEVVNSVGDTQSVDRSLETVIAALGHANSVDGWRGVSCSEVRNELRVGAIISLSTGVRAWTAASDVPDAACVVGRVDVSRPAIVG